MSKIFDHYKKFNFSIKELGRLKKLDNDVIRFTKLQKGERKKIIIIEKRISEYERKKSDLWRRASKMLESLQKRCNHHDTYKQKIYRDFGQNKIRKHCCFCDFIVKEYYED